MSPLFEPTMGIREYFDAGVEFSHPGKEEKLFEIANCVYHGYNLYNALEKYLEEHRESNRRRTFCNTLCEYIGILRGDKKITSYIHLTLKELVNLFTEEVFRLYRHPRHGKPYFASVKEYYDDVINNYSNIDRIKALKRPTPLDKIPIPITEEELREINPWGSCLEYVDPIRGGSTIYDDNAQCVLKCDEAYISEHNRNKDAEYKYRIQKWPKPFMGNPLSARVVLLSLNPGFKDWQKRVLAKALTIYYREAIFKHLVEQSDLKAVSMFCPNNKPGDLDITYLEAHTLVDNYWYDMIEKFRNAAGIPKSDEVFDPLYTRLSVIEYLGYASTSYKDLAKGRILPSQYFSRMLIQHLTMNRETVFVVVRAEEQWKKLLGERIWNKLEQEDRLIVGRKIRCQSLTATGLGENGFRKLVNLLK